MNTIMSVHTTNKYMKEEVRFSITEYPSYAMPPENSYTVYDLHVEQGYNHLQICMNLEQFKRLAQTINDHLSKLIGEADEPTTGG